MINVSLEGVMGIQNRVITIGSQTENSYCVMGSPKIFCDYEIPLNTEIFIK